MRNNSIKAYESYAKIVIKYKGLDEDPVSLVEIAKTLSESFGRTYHAVALDIDGTIKIASEERISSSILDAITRVVKAGAYVLFVTGSGSSTVKRILNQVKDEIPRSQKNYYNKICAIDGNGCRLFSIDSDGFITSTQIVQPVKGKITDEKYRELIENINSSLGDCLDIQEKTCGIRLVSNGTIGRDDLERIVASWFKKAELDYWNIGINVTASRWGDKPTFDISNTDKDYALTWFYTEFDFIDVPILRIGDQGKEKGNDFSFLDSSYGFSVEDFSSKPNKCFPIYDTKRGKILKGLEGTCYLLNNLKWSSRLTIPSTLISRLSYEDTCERLRRGAKNNILHTAKFWSRFAHPIFPRDVIKNCYKTEFSNIFDHKSGAIRLTDMEWNSFNESGSIDHRLADFFAEKKQIPNDDKNSPGLLRSLYTDTGVILRGERYYCTITLVLQLYIVPVQL